MTEANEVPVTHMCELRAHACLFESPPLLIIDEMRRKVWIYSDLYLTLADLHGKLCCFVLVTVAGF